MASLAESGSLQFCTVMDLLQALKGQLRAECRCCKHSCACNHSSTRWAVGRVGGCADRRTNHKRRPHQLRSGFHRHHWLRVAANASYHIDSLPHNSSESSCVPAAGALSTAAPATTAAPGGVLGGLGGALTPAPTTSASPTIAGVLGFPSTSLAKSGSPCIALQ